MQGDANGIRNGRTGACRTRLRRRTLALCLVLCTASTGTAIAQTGKVHEPRLLLFITVDQARYDYFVRFRPLLTGGLKELLDRGIVFSQAFHDHAITATAPGHATLATGLVPAHSGLVSNQWFDRSRGEPVYSLQDTRHPVLRRGTTSRAATPSRSGRSPKNLLGTTLADWLKAANTNSKIYAAGGKDRSSITMAGKSADAAFWYDQRNGDFVTSTYYAERYPEWVNRFHRDSPARRLFGKTWEPLPLDTETLERVEVEATDFGVFQWELPHPVGNSTFAPTASYYTAFFGTPFIDAYLMEFAKALIEQERLGEDGDLDFLALCFSATDAVGHQYGPDSPELLDAFLRLDRLLGDLLQFLAERVGSEQVAIVLSADHGVMPLPESRRGRAEQARRFTAQDVACYQSVEHELDAALGEDDWLAPYADPYLNWDAVARHQLRRAEVEDRLARALETCPSVAKAWTRTELESGTAHSDETAALYRNSFQPDRSPDVLIQLKRFHIRRPATGTTHGSAYAYDRHVPVILLFAGLEPAVIETPIRTVDVAPTVAALLGLSLPGSLDGVDRGSLLTKHETTRGER